MSAFVVKQETDRMQQGKANFAIEAVLDNIRSAWNVGSMFRTADGMCISSIYLCGITPTPLHPQVRRTALGAENTIRWEYASNAVSLVKSQISDGKRLWVLEETRGAENLYDLLMDNNQEPILLAVGNEISGVDPGLLELAEKVISIPMGGRKRSYNVAVAFGIATSYLRYGHNLSQESVRIFPKT